MKIFSYTSEMSASVSYVYGGLVYITSFEIVSLDMVFLFVFSIYFIFQTN